MPPRRASPATGCQWAAGLAGGRHGTFAAYLGVGSEPPTLPLICGSSSMPGTACCFRSANPDSRSAGCIGLRQSEFVRSRYAPIQEPAGERHGTAVMRDATAIFLPATAVDFSGNRIGQGGGYYDKFLAALSAISLASGEASDAAALPTAAVVYDTEVLPAGSIPAESFDRKVDAALTPGGIIRLGCMPPRLIWVPARVIELALRPCDC